MRRPGWFKAQRSIWSLPVSPKARYMMLALESFVSDNSCYCMPSIRALCERTGYERKAVMRALSELASPEVQAIWTVRRSGDHNKYFLAVSATPCPALELVNRSLKGTGDDHDLRSNQSLLGTHTEQSSTEIADGQATGPKKGLDQSQIGTTPVPNRDTHVHENSFENSLREVHASPSATPPGIPSGGMTLEDLVRQYGELWAHSANAPPKAFTVNGQDRTAGKLLKQLLGLGEEAEIICSVIEFFFLWQNEHYIRTGRPVHIFRKDYYTIKQAWEAYRDGDSSVVQGPRRRGPGPASGGQRGADIPIR